jgi:cytoskeletal protein CcmA (bactofilin family)
MFTKGNGKLPSPSEEISAFLGKETVFEGKMTFQGVFRLDGKFEGEIFDSGSLVIGETALVKGKIEVKTVVVHGVIEGDVHAGVRAEIHPTGKIYGNLVTPILLINEGGIFEGNCKMDRVTDQKENTDPQSPREERSLSD